MYLLFYNFLTFKNTPPSAHVTIDLVLNRMGIKVSLHEENSYLGSNFKSPIFV